MHEFGIVEEMIHEISDKLHQQGVERVKEIRFRRDSTFSKDALEQAYEMLSPHTPLEGATLVIEDQIIINKCKGCGYQEPVNENNMLGHYYVCPECGEGVYIDEHHGLHVVDIQTG